MRRGGAGHRGADARAADRRADDAEPGVPPVGDRDDDGGLGRGGGGAGAKIRDTRKTLPGLRALQKYAVRVGGGVNHRMGLGDAALIKDNHVAAAGSVVAALRAVRDVAPDLPCEVEVDSLEQLDEVLGENVELVLLDNFPVWQTQIAAQRRDARAPRKRNSSPRAGCRWTPPPSTRERASTTWPSAPSPIRCACSISAWTSSRGYSLARAQTSHGLSQ